MPWVNDIQDKSTTFETSEHNNADENYGHKAIAVNRAALFFPNK
jgi:hypothetical protein